MFTQQNQDLLMLHQNIATAQLVVISGKGTTY